MSSQRDYEAVNPADVPQGIVWVVPAANQGQVVEVAYSRGIPGGRQVNYDAASGDPWMRVTDTSDPARQAAYYRLAR